MSKKEAEGGKRKTAEISYYAAIHLVFPPIYVVFSLGGIHSTVVANWTAGQPVKQSTLHQRHDS